MNAGELGLGHVAHPWLGREVLDTASGKTGILRAVAPEPNDLARRGYLPVAPEGDPVAWLSPLGGGVEWTTDRKALEVVGRGARK
jgi:hypothetical protein